MGRDRKKILLVLGAVAFLALLVTVVQPFLRHPPATLKRAAIAAGEYDPAVWGRPYPLEYQSYLRTGEEAPSPTGFGGSVKEQKALKEPEIRINFKGMAFSVDYAEDRGHRYALEDLRTTKRVDARTAGACMTCKTPHIEEIYREKGWDYAKLPLVELLPRLRHAVSCASCHDPATMDLRVLNPAFVEAMAARGVDVKQAPREAMRTYVCAQCHVEYYFVPEGKKVVLPWGKGLDPGQIYAYYAETPNGFAMDWQHPDSGAPMLKAQHPEFEFWSGGVHAASGVSCADCHMPYEREEGQKYTSHWVTSPMKHARTACGTCHRQGEAWLLARVKATQAGVWEMQRTAGQTVARAHQAIGRAAGGGQADGAALEKARALVRQAQWYWDFVAAENSMGFHNPTLALTTLGRSVDLAHQAIAAAERR